MPRIVLPRFLRPNESLLRNKNFSDPGDLYNEGIYDSGAGLPGPDIGSRGVMSQINGRLGSENFNPSTQIRDYHIQPRQASLCGSEGMLGTATIYGDGVDASNDDTSYFTLPGCSFRWYQPFDTSVSLMQWSFFLSYNAWRGTYKDMNGETHAKGIETPIYIRCRLDDNVVTSSSRRLGQNFFHPQSPGAIDKDNQTGPGTNAFKYLQDTYERNNEPLADGYFGAWPTAADEGGDAAPDGLSWLLDTIDLPSPSMPAETVANGIRARGGNPKYVQTEAHSAVHFDFHHSTKLSKGYHEISVEASVAAPRGVGVYLQNLGRAGVSGLTGRGYFNLVGKLSLGIRNARVLNLL